MSRPEVLLFPDTNVFLHFRMFDEIDWRMLVGGAPVVLALTRNVVGELDRHKNENKSRRLRDRAGAALARIEAFALSQQPVRPGVRLETLRAYASRERAPEDLDLNRADDAHVASALQSQADGHDVRVVTADTGMRLAARAHGLQAVQPPEVARHPIEPDEAEAELRKLKLENEKLRAVKQPKIAVRFVDGTHLARFDRPWIFVEAGEVELPDALVSHVRGLDDLKFEALGAPASFREKLKSYKQAKFDFDEDIALTVALRLTLFNNGDAPARGVHVALRFPDRILIRDALPREPRRPQWPPTDLFGLGDASIPGLQLLDPDEWTLAGSAVELSRRQIVQSLHEELPVLYVRPHERREHEGFQITGRLVVSEPPSQEDFTLHVLLDKEAGQ